MTLEHAKTIAEEFCEVIKPFCERLEIVGSIRRMKEYCNDIDILLIPKNQNLLPLYTLITHERKQDFTVNKWGKKFANLVYSMTQIDLYFATEEIWSTLLLIRTGSKYNNIRLCKVAQGLGCKLKADGSGLFDACSGNRLPADSEESIYKTLGLRYQSPVERV